jgi:hypothetical protein
LALVLAFALAGALAADAAFLVDADFRERVAG